MNRKDKNILLSLMLGIGLLFSYFEIAALRAAELVWSDLLAPAGSSAAAFYSLLFFAGVFILARDLWSVSADLPAPVRPAWLGWVSAAGLIVVTAWIHLYSPWQAAVPGPWTQLVFAAGLAQIIALILGAKPRGASGWSGLALTLGLFLFPRVVLEIRAFSGLSSLSRGTALLGFFLVMALIFLLYHPYGERLRPGLLKFRTRLGRARWLIAALFWLAPIVYHYTVGAQAYILLANTRFLVLLAAFWMTAFLTCDRSGQLVSPDSLGLNFGILILVSAFNSYLLLIVNYPFSLTWSEGNRFYDYSLVFGQGRYDYPGRIIDIYNTPGRYGLWGVLYLWNDSPIWMHRLWNLILQTFPPLLFAFLVTRRLQPASLRYRVALWIGLFFIVLVPLHPPFMLASALVVLFAFDESPIKRGISLLLASLYVGLSRFTWVFAPGAMGALIDLLLYYPKRTGHWFRRLIPTIVLTALGVAPSLVRNFRSLAATAQGETLTNQQPLLWYRLLPNNTLGPGVLFLALLYTAPLLILVAWWIFSGRWKLDWVQKTAIAGVLTGFSAAGLVISTKIGGGGDLHNLDMYLVALILVVALGLTVVTQGQERVQWPAWASGLVIFLALFPVFQFTPLSPNATNSSRLDLPASDQVDMTLAAIRAEVDRAAPQGEILFMDQRQLLTYGYVRAIPFVPEYEKKYMMDQALASNEIYFRSYYQDLADQRFALIVTEPLKINLKGAGGLFSEENDLWVTWVSAPTLCFYEPIFTDKTVGVEMLVPRQDPAGCEKYLQ
jgi:hypothetical protein